MRHTRYDESPGCAIEAAMEVIGGKWKGVILHHLLSGSLRFGGLRKRVPEVTQRMLTQQLRELEADGVVLRTVHAVVPPRVDYELTDFGRTLAPLLHLMQSWGQVYMDSNGLKLRERS